MMKRFIILLLVAAVLVGALSGCGQKEAGGAFTASNEIFTYQKVDPAKTQIVVSRTGNIAVEPLCEAFEARNPDTQVIYLDITGGNSTYVPLTEWIEHGDLPDVVISAAEFSDDEVTKKYFVDQSENPILQDYEVAALQRSATDAHVYWLPGPSDISAMMYNKTLFDQYGWAVPATFDEFVALCDQIRADTNGAIEAWNPNAKYSNELLTAIEAFTYEELLGGLENRTWYNRLLDGEATLTEHMQPYVDVLQTLIDHQILREEHFTYSATARGKAFTAGTIAMINGVIYDAGNDAYDFALMPFPTTAGDLGYLCDSFSCSVGVPVKAHTDKESDAIARFLAFFTSQEGQEVYIGNALKVSNVKGVPLNQSADMSGLQAAVDAGHMFGRMDFFGVNTNRGIVDLHTVAQKMISGDMTGTQCLEEIDARLANPDVAEKTPQAAPDVVGKAAEDFSILETSFLMADMYREAAGADIGLIAHNIAYRGNLMRIYAGDITADRITVFKPRSFANDATLVKLSMTGRQIEDALNNPVGNDQTPNCAYAFSGLRCEVAPWRALGQKYLSVKLADGSVLEADKLYTVAAWAGTVADAYVTETLESYPGTWEELMTAKLQAAKTIAPAKDGRIKLIWD